MASHFWATTWISGGWIFLRLLPRRNGRSNWCWNVEARTEARVKSEARVPAIATTTALDDRRARVRAKVVTCIDMSRGGLGLKTKNAYAISTEVTVAVPFSPESPNAPAIYVPARAVNIAELPELKMFRCGVAFLPVAGTRAHS